MQTRPDPDELLARVQAEETKQQRGRLKIFFGAAAGVGKTYAMLEAARVRRAEGVDVVVGYAETHGRRETDALLSGLEHLPTLAIEHRGVVLREFDLDGALARKPQLILVDELAHTNAPGTRHPKRYQDIEELLAAGIDVYTTVNVQHLESLNDVVAQITGVIVRETVPDYILEAADQVELIDLTPDDLLQRLKEGKVYLPQQAERAIRSFFRKGNLIALRELALRRMADRVDAQMEDYRRDHAIRETWPATMRLLVGVSGSPAAMRLVRAARRMATMLRADWIVVYVESSDRIADAHRDQAIQTLRLAEQLGAETVTLSGTNIADALLAFAHERNITTIIIGKPERPRWHDLLFGAVADDLLRKSGLIDIHVLSGETDEALPHLRAVFRPTTHSRAYAWAPAMVVVMTILAFGLDYLDFSEANVVMVYLLGVLVVALNSGRGPSVLATLLSVLSFNFFFVEPRLTFAISDTRYFITFGVMLAVGLVVSTLMARFRRQAEAARARERRTAALYALSRELAGARTLEAVARSAVHHLADVFESKVVLLFPVAQHLQPWGNLTGWARDLNLQRLFAPSPSELGVAQWVFDHREMAGLSTATLSASDALYMPLIRTQGTVGVLGIRPEDRRRFQAPEQIHLLETFANQIALAIERALLADEAQQAQISAETERMRAALLSSVSHDFRTPLAVVSGSLSSLTQDYATLDDPTRLELAQAALSESERLNRLIGNLLDMTRLEAGAIQVRKEWQPLEEVIGAALARIEAVPEMKAALQARDLQIDLPPDLPPVPLDDVLIEQVFFNLFDNALKHTPPGTPVSVAARATPGEVLVEVADHGPGLPPSEEQRVFDKFYRGQQAARGRGNVGLGLSICRGMVEAHGGQIWALPRNGGGTIFRFSLPLTGYVPAVTATS